MDSNCYIRVKPYRDQIDLFERSGEVVTDLTGLWDIIDDVYNQNAQKIDRSCTPCRVGFLKFIISELKRYEKDNNIT